MVDVGVAELRLCGIDNPDPAAAQRSEQFFHSCAIFGYNGLMTNTTTQQPRTISAAHAALLGLTRDCVRIIHDGNFVFAVHARRNVRWPLGTVASWPGVPA